MQKKQQMKLETLQDFADFSKKVISLADKMDEVFGDEFHAEHLTLSIMAGLYEIKQKEE